MWKDYELSVNSLTTTVRFNEDTVAGLFVPFLTRLNALHKNLSRRVIVFVAAPPATGKSTLALFLEKLANEQNIPLAAIGLDGFHYDNDYLKEHFTQRNGQTVPLYSVKGAPETFDAEGLKKKLDELKNNPTVKWPVYSRRLHNPVADGQEITGDKIILLEGNWLLLKETRWAALADFADYTLFIKADEDVLKDRLISRKVAGGFTEEEATRFYEQSDKANVVRTLYDSRPADETWIMSDEGDFTAATPS